MYMHGVRLHLHTSRSGVQTYLEVPGEGHLDVFDVPTTATDWYWCQDMEEYGMFGNIISGPVSPLTFTPRSIIEQDA